ncbi:zinc finger protein, putative [Bodo saltans]|uniref:Zinc finger protein, putative n=1 Tax=Bodo saltans TaxID=75058 RepID=A0A0S4JNW6_BODSA|nr:zinc finger protein, putative [Bodo saltans]|eukprot:CUG91840.1 zinc finger protein, putative [Bodo saltans]
MGGSSSREHRRNNPPVVRNQHQSPPQRQANPMPPHLQTQFRSRPNQGPPPSALPPGGMSPASRNAIQEGKKVKTLATVEPTSVHFEPELQLLTFRLTSDVTTFTWYEVHTGVRETIKGNKVVYTPNKPKAAPQRMRLDGLQDDAELAVQLELTGMSDQELKYTPLYPKQRPCVLVIGYTDEDGRESMEHKGNKVVYTPNKPKAAPQRMRLDGLQDDAELAVQLELTGMSDQELKYTPLYPKQRPCVLVIGYTDEDGRESMEHTSVDLNATATRRVTGQIVETDGACYSAESVFGGDHEVVAGAVVEGDANGGTSPATGGIVEGDDEDDKLCVICLTNDKDTAVIPCRHLCLCKECAGTLMQHTPKCPVCRGPISQLLHMGE